jgi:predicted nuclease of restriction endonuclease-like (RecB) superfamily
MSQPGRLDKVLTPLRAKEYARFLGQVKARIRTAQVKATLAANRELILLYWDIGRRLGEAQKRHGWGKGVIPRLARDLRSDLPEVKGFSERNLGYMLAFAREYGRPPIPQQPVAELPEAMASLRRAATAKAGDSVQQSAAALALSIPWGHNILLMEKVKNLRERLGYMCKALDHGWSRNMLLAHIENRTPCRDGKALTNFSRVLPPPQSDLAVQALKDPYIFDFLTLDAPFRERELETGLLAHLEKFLIELGAGFAFVGRQVRLQVGREDFYVDLLFYHLRLRCFVVIELKTGPFKADYAGKMNFYLNVADDRLRHPSDKPSIGLILCQHRNRVLAEYALRGLDKAIGVSEYHLTRALPAELKSSLPTTEEIEAELATTKRPRTLLPLRKARCGRVARKGD